MRDVPHGFSGLNRLPSYYAKSPELSLGFMLALLRIILHVAAALAVIQFSDRIVSWFAKDWFATSSPSNSDQPSKTVTDPKV